jgi:hypothetical protein
LCGVASNIPICTLCAASATIHRGTGGQHQLHRDRDQHQRHRTAAQATVTPRNVDLTPILMLLLD